MMKEVNMETNALMRVGVHETKSHRSPFYARCLSLIVYFKDTSYCISWAEAILLHIKCRG